MDLFKKLLEELSRINSKLDRLNNVVMGLPTTHNTNLGDWLTEEQAQELLGKRTTSLWGLRKTGQVKFSKIGGRIYYDRQSILDHLKSNSSK